MSFSPFPRVQVLIVEGTIGAGKTLLINSIVNALAYAYPNLVVKVLSEEIDDEFLAMYIADMKKYAFAFQTNMATKRAMQWENVIKEWPASTLTILDRSRIGDAAFAKLLASEELISPEEMQVYWRHSLGSETKSLAAAHDRARVSVLYVDVSPDKAFSRIKKRGNGDEAKGYSLEYLSKLGEQYQKVFAEMESVFKKAKLVRLDWNVDLEVQKNGCIAVEYLTDLLIDLGF